MTDLKSGSSVLDGNVDIGLVTVGEEGALETGFGRVIEAHIDVISFSSSDV